METPADRLRQARAKKQIETAVEAADRMKIPRTTYQNYEDGSRGFSRHIVKISKFYGVRPQWLLAGQLPMMILDFENKLNELGPEDQAKAWEYLEMLAAKARRT